MTEQQIFEKLKSVLETTFEIDPDKISMESKLYSDLDIDSIDAVDMIVEIRPLLGKRKLNPNQFNQNTTVGDVVSAIKNLLEQPEDSI